MSLFGGTETKITVPLASAAAAGQNQLAFLSVTFDAVEKVDEDLSCVVTDEPVEDGTNVADNIRDNADKLDLDVLVSRTPIMSVFSLLAESESRHEDAWSYLKLMKSAHLTVTLTTPTDTYEDMAIESLRRTRNARTGEVMAASIKLKKIVKVVATEAALPERAAADQKTVKTKADVTPEPQSQSVFYSAVH
jgi:hypothetical protein